MSCQRGAPAVEGCSREQSCQDGYKEAGEGGRLATRRQEGILWEEERMREERELIWAARVRGQALLQPGRILF